MLCTHTKMTMSNPDSVAHVVPFVNTLRKLPGMTMVGIRDDRAKLVNCWCWTFYCNHYKRLQVTGHEQHVHMYNMCRHGTYMHVPTACTINYLILTQTQ